MAASVLAVVPARGGSKGVPLKNLHPLWGRPLLAHTAELIQALSGISRAVISTDHEDIADVATAAGLAAPFRRPPELSGDRIADWDVLVHALREMEQLDETRYDIVLMLQPTCPQRRSADVQATLTKLIEGNWDAVWTVSPTDLKYHPRKALTIDGEGALAFYHPDGAGVIARQQLIPTYYRNGAAYAIRRKTLLDQGAIMGARSAAVVVEEPLISIDTMEDFETLEVLKPGPPTNP